MPYIDALFTAAAATCVTGLATVPLASTWSTFGHAVILVLVQIGGLGVVTVLSGFMIALQRRIGITDRLLIQDAFNLNGMSGLVRFVKKVIFGTFAVELAGALLYLPVFVPQYGARGVWYSVFTAVSAFCNAGMDIMSADSLCAYATDPLVNAVTCALVVLGGLGYVVWWDVLRVLRQFRTRGLRCLRGLTLHSKLALSSTAVLLAGGAALFLLLEYDNPLTLGPHGFGNKLQIAMFQSVSARTAGFVTVPQKDLTNASALVTLLLMFIGGSPVSTAGGIKTVTALVLAAYAWAMLRGRDEVALWGRAISRQTLAKAMSVAGVAFATVFATALLLSCTVQADMLDILYEAFGAATTVGFSRGLTPTLGLWGKLTVTAAMYLGRVGPISLAVAFNIRKTSPNIIKNPTEDISVG